MSWCEERSTKVKETLGLIIRIVLDVAVVIFLGYAIQFMKDYLASNVYQKPFEVLLYRSSCQNKKNTTS